MKQFDCFDVVYQVFFTLFKEIKAKVVVGFLILFLVKSQLSLSQVIYFPYLQHLEFFLCSNAKLESPQLLILKSPPSILQ
jgi:hypothetical protein